MPLWSSTRTNSYSSSSSSAPQLPPLPHFTPPSTSQLPHFEPSNSNNKKGKQPLTQVDGDGDGDDDPWQDGSDDETTVKKLEILTATTAPPRPPNSPPLTTPTITTTPGVGGGGWFSSFTSFATSPSSTSPSVSNPSTRTTHPKVLKRQPSAKDVAVALSGSKSPSSSSSSSATSPSTTTTTNRLSLPEGFKRSGGSYIGKVNEVQKAADQLVKEEVRRKSIESGNLSSTMTTTTTTDEEARQHEEVRGEGEGDEENTTPGGGGGGSEKERLRNSIRRDVFQLVKDPTSVLPRLRREWLSRPCRPPTSSSSASTRTTTTTPNTSSSLATTVQDDDDDDDVTSPRPSISSVNSDEEGRPRGYVPLNASSLSSSTTKPVVDYQREYGSSTSRTTGTSTSRGGGGGGGGNEDEEEDASESLLEEPGELGRETRRKKKFLDVLQGIDPSSTTTATTRRRGTSQGDDSFGSDEPDEFSASRRDRQGGGGGGGETGETDLGELRKLSWGGVPEGLRVVVWMLLLGYLPSPFSRRPATLARKRQEYADAVKLAFSRGVKGLDGPIWHQISIDVPRTRPGVRLWMVEGTQRSLERILYVWAIRHPASGYVQGINDLVTPFFQVFLSLYIDSDPEEFDPSLLPPCALEALEADSFWCLSKLLDGIQDNYIFAQPGITRAVKKMELLCKRVDAPLAKHLQSEGVEFIQFAFRWMNCLLMRELSVKNIVRMWDTYLAEGGDAFSEFHLYVCLSFLVKWSEQLRTMDFQSIIMFLQSLPTKDWKDSNTELLLSEAFMWSRTFEAR